MSLKAKIIETISTGGYNLLESTPEDKKPVASSRTTKAHKITEFLASGGYSLLEQNTESTAQDYDSE